MLLLPLLGPQQFEFRVPLNQFDQVCLLPLFWAVDLHLAFPLLRQPVLKKLLLRKSVLHQQLRRHFNRIDLGVVLFNHPLQNQTRCQS